MHVEVLVEGQAELTTLSILMEKILGPYRQPHTWKIHKHKGIGKLPANPGGANDRKDQTLLHNLPSKLRAYGRDMTADEAVLVLVDLDDRDCSAFKRELVSLLKYCDPEPRAKFRIAIEELEAWFFGDQIAIRRAYPNARQDVLESYASDSICGTWERLADAVHPGGSHALKSEYGKRSPKVLEQKVTWAKQIAPHMDVENNDSPSFRCFRACVRRGELACRIGHDDTNCLPE